MSALIILIVLGIWSALVYNAGYYAGFGIERKWIRRVVGVTAVVAVTTLMLWDEIKGTQEFERLCATGGAYQILPEAIGRKFDLIYGSGDYKDVPGLTRPATEKLITYTDVANGTVVATGKAYFARGGWMIRNRILSSESGPLFGRPQCFPPSDAVQELRLRAITNKVVN